MSGDVILASVLAHQGVVHAGPVGPGVVALLVAACVVFVRALAKDRTPP